MIYSIKRFKVYIATLISIALLYISLKYIVTYFVISSVKNLIDSEPLQNQVTIHNVNFEPLSLSLAIKNLEFDKDFSLSNLYINFSFPNIFSKKIYISKIKVDGLNVSMTKKSGKFTIKNLSYKGNLPININKTKNNWKAKIDQIEILESNIIDPYDNNINLKKIIVSNFDLIERDNLMNLEAAIQIDGSDISLSGNIPTLLTKEASGNISFQIDNLNLDIINDLIDNPDRGFKKIKGKLSAKGVVSLKEESINLDINSKLKDLLFDSRNLKTIIQVNSSNIALNGNIAMPLSRKSGNMSFQIDDLKLDIANSPANILDRGFGKIKGKLSAKGFVNLEGGSATMDINSQLQNLFLYSQDLKTINYFIKDLSLSRLKIANDKTLFSINSPSLNINNLILSIPSKDFNYNNLSKFSKIKISHLNILRDKKNATANGIIKFSNGGFIATNQYGKINKEKIDIKVSNLDLTQFSETFEALLSYQIGSGNLSIDSNIYLDNNKIKGATSINLGQLYLDNENELGVRLKNSSIIPLKTVISMIKDDNGNIEANFQMYGNKNNPKFNILNIIKKGLGAVLISKASSIIASKLALKLTPILASSVPFSPGSALSFANGAYKVITKPRFNDIEFLALTSKIKVESRDILNEFIKFLEKNKETKFQICPVASVFESKDNKDDKKISTKRVLSLAQERIDVLMKYFKERLSVDLSQIVFCRPKISDTNKDVSVATVSL